MMENFEDFKLIGFKMKFVQLSHFNSVFYVKIDINSPKMNEIRKKCRILAFFIKLKTKMLCYQLFFI
jgi:hypothetical protein